MINYEYADLAYRAQEIANKKDSDFNIKKEKSSINSQMLAMEIDMPVQDIFDSVREAFKHIPPRI